MLASALSLCVDAPLKFCATNGCSQRVTHGHCQAHTRQRDINRGTRHERGYTNQWARYSKRRLQHYPLCEGYPTGHHGTDPVAADVTDHILSARARPDLFLEATNHQSLCSECNKRKAIAEEGGFGR